MSFLESLIELLKKAGVQPTNLIDRAWSIIAQEEQSIITANRIAEKIAQTLPATILTQLPQPDHQIIDKKNFSASSYTLSVSCTGLGSISLTIISPSTSFSIIVKADGDIKHSGTYTDYEQVNLGEIDSSDNYRVDLSNISFKKTFEVTIYSSVAITYSRIYAEIKGLDLNIIKGQ